MIIINKKTVAITALAQVVSIGYLYLVCQLAMKFYKEFHHHVPDRFANIQNSSFLYLTGTVLWTTYLLWPEANRETKSGKILFTLGMLVPILFGIWGFSIFVKIF